MLEFGFQSVATSEHQPFRIFASNGIVSKCYNVQLRLLGCMADVDLVASN